MCAGGAVPPSPPHPTPPAPHNPTPPCQLKWNKPRSSSYPKHLGPHHQTHTYADTHARAHTHTQPPASLLEERLALEDVDACTRGAGPGGGWLVTGCSICQLCIAAHDAQGTAYRPRPCAGFPRKERPRTSCRTKGAQRSKSGAERSGSSPACRAERSGRSTTWHGTHPCWPRTQRPGRQTGGGAPCAAAGLASASPQSPPARLQGGEGWGWVRVGWGVVHRRSGRVGE